MQRTFTVSRVGTIAGCRVIAGIVARNARIRVIRDSRVVGDYAIESLAAKRTTFAKYAKDMECGIKLANFNDVKEADILEVYRIEEVARTL